MPAQYWLSKAPRSAVPLYVHVVNLRHQKHHRRVPRESDIRAVVQLHWSGGIAWSWMGGVSVAGRRRRWNDLARKAIGG